MNITLDEFLLNVRVADGLDVLILTVVIYLVWRWLHRRAPRAVAVALFGLGALYVVSGALNMYLTMAVFRAGLTVLFFAVVVVFQEDLRNAVERLASWRPFTARAPVHSNRKVIDELVEAVMLLAGEKVGALIVLPGRQPLDRHVRGGTPVEGRVSIDLLHSIFHSASRGHDGGVILKNGRVDRLGVHLPLSANLAAVGSRGTRHAAALGLSERTDALVIVVSEERGTTTLAQRAELTEVSAAQLESRLLDFLQRETISERGSMPRGERIRMLCAQAGSFGVALLMWYVFAFRIETVQRTIDNVPVELRNVPRAWAVDDTAPEVVQVTLVGPERAFATFDPTALKATVNMSGASSGPSAIPIREEHLQLPEDIHLQRASPDILRFQLHSMTERQLPVKVVTNGNLPAGLGLASLTAEPDSLAVRVPARRNVEGMSLQTEPVNLGAVQSTRTVNARVRFPQGVEPAPRTPRVVRVRISVQPASPQQISVESGLPAAEKPVD